MLLFHELAPFVIALVTVAASTIALHVIRQKSSYKISPEQAVETLRLTDVEANFYKCNFAYIEYSHYHMDTGGL